MLVAFGVYADQVSFFNLFKKIICIYLFVCVFFLFLIYFTTNYTTVAERLESHFIQWEERELFSSGLFPRLSNVRHVLTAFSLLSTRTPSHEDVTVFLSGLEALETVMWTSLNWSRLGDHVSSLDRPFYALLMLYEHSVCSLLLFTATAPLSSLPWINKLHFEAFSVRSRLYIKHNGRLTNPSCHTVILPNISINIYSPESKYDITIF